MTTYLLFLCLSIAIQSTATSDANIATSHLNEACKQTFDADVCIKVLSIYPESQTFNSHGLTSLAITVKSFMHAFDQLNKSRMVMDRDVFEDVNLWMMAAKTDGQVCEERCKNLPDMKVQLNAKSAEFSKLCSIILNMTSVLITSY